VDISRVDRRGWSAARCRASAQETVVFPTPPLPTTNVSLATEAIVCVTEVFTATDAKDAKIDKKSFFQQDLIELFEAASAYIT
jgi:hypothetical protein